MKNLILETLNNNNIYLMKSKNEKRSFEFMEIFNENIKLKSKIETI